MPVGHPQRNPPPEAPIQDSNQSASSKATHIRNKDGTKLITVSSSRKASDPDYAATPATPTAASTTATTTNTTAITTSSSSSSSSSSSTTTTTSTTTAADSLTLSPPPPPPPPVAAPAPMDYSNGANSNSTAGKKKKKKRGKQAQAQQLQQQQLQQQQAVQHRRKPSGDDDYGYNRSNGPSAPPPPPTHPLPYQQDIRNSMADFDDNDPPELVDPEDEEEYYSDQDGEYDENESYSPPPPSAPAPAVGKSKKSKKKKKKAAGGGNDHAGGGGGGGGGGGQLTGRKGKDRIWNTSTSEERERIKDFWLSLGEEERRSLVKVEKEAVLRKMKEQQKHSCSCSVCGRKRTAIEEELEVLYDAYYEELEQYANQQQTNKYLTHVPPSPPPGAYNSIPPPPPPPPGPSPRLLQGNHVPTDHDTPKPEDVDEEFEDDDDDDYEDDDEVLDHPMSPPPQNDPRPDFFNFGNSLTVQGGILTVADDLLKNDGKKFIEMMEQLAERRMAREEEANNPNGTVSRDVGMHHQHVHNHTQPSEYDEEEYDDEEDEEEEYDDDDEEEDEPDTMTEEQRMEEGRRMFQIFAARMFEQRVLQAYREKVARERQQKLLEELEEEDRRKEEREAKRAQDKEKKREKKRQTKQAKEEERLRKEAEKREEEEKQKAIEAKKAEEQRKRREELRQKKEAEKKAAEEERRRKEEEKRKRLEEEREREAKRERKKKENEERERKKKEEAARKAKEEKEAREKELREKREREDREKRDREAKAKKDAAERDRKRKEDEAKMRADVNAAALKRAQTAFAPVPTMPHSAPPSGYGSPHLPVVTPATPKQSAGPQLHRPRNSSQQGSIHGSQCSSPKTPSVGPRLGSTTSPSTPILQHNMPGPIPVKGFQYPGIFPPTSPMLHHIGPPPGVTPPEGIFPMSPMGMSGPNPMQPFLSGIPQRQPILNGMPLFSGQIPLNSPQYRGFSTPNGMPMQTPPPAPGMRPMAQQGRGLFMPDMPHQLPPGVPLPPPGSPFGGSRVEPIPMSGHSRIPSATFDHIHRPAPIQRPSSVAPQRSGNDQVDELSKVMGSRALLEDEDDVLTENLSPSRRVSGPQFAPRPMRSVGTPALFGETLGSGYNDFGASWSNPLPLGGSMSGSLPSTWANKAGWSDIDAGAFNRRRTTRVDQIRILACQKYQDLGGPSHQPVELAMLQRAVQMGAPADLQFQPDELVHTLDVEGDAQNGGGSFDQRLENGRILVYYSPDRFADQHHRGPIRAGEIGSPSTTGAVPYKSPLMGPPPGMTPSPAGF